MTGQPPRSNSSGWETAKILLSQILMSWGLPGVFGLLAVHFVRQSPPDWTQASVYLALAVAIALLTRLLHALNPRLDSLFEWLANHIERAVRWSWWQLTNRFQAAYYQHLIYQYRDFRTQGLKTKSPFALNLESVFVPLRIGPESLNRVTSAMVQVAQTPDTGLAIWDFMAQYRHPTFQRLVVLGPPGSGKTTLLEHIALSYARNTHRRHHRGAPRLIPILLYLRDHWEEIVTSTSISLADLVHQQAEAAHLHPAPGWFADRLRQGQCWVMLDGLDEVADAAFRRQVSHWVDEQMRTYPQTPFLITSRPFGYRSAPLNQSVTVLEVQPFTLAQMEQFVQNWYWQNELMRRLGKDDPGVRQTAQVQANDLIGRIKRTPALAAMALNPLLLTMIATVHCYRGVLPGRRVELYAEMCDVLLGRRQDAKGMTDSLTVAQKKVVLQRIALNRMTKKRLSFKTVTGMLLIREKLTTVAGESVAPDAFLKQIENVSGLLVERDEGVYGFVHKSIQEYLAAVEIRERQQELILTRNIDDPWWDETIRLYAAQTDASNLIWAALQRQTSDNAIHALTLAYDCLEEGLSIQADIRQELATTLNRGLESPDPDVFKLAAEVKLARRLKHLLRLNDTTDIDTGLITCAEYQLFIDDQRQGDHPSDGSVHSSQFASHSPQPDHWGSQRFPVGQASLPVAGVKASNAEAFCDWLTHRTNALGDTYLETGSPIFVGTVKFRLPTLAEAQQSPIPSDTAVGYWSCEAGTCKIAGIPPEQWQSWQTLLMEHIDSELSAASGYALSLNVDFDRNRARTYDLTDDLTHHLRADLPLDRDSILAHIQGLTDTLSQGLADIRDLDSDFHRDLRLALGLNLIPVLTQDQDQDLIYARAEFYALLWIVEAALHKVGLEYAQMAQNVAKLKQAGLSATHCQALAQAYQQTSQQVLNTCLLLALAKGRRRGTLPAWEGIRLVREQLG